MQRFRPEPSCHLKRDINHLQSLSKRTLQTGFRMFYMGLSQVFTLSISPKDDPSKCQEHSNNNRNYLIIRKKRKRKWPTFQWLIQGLSNRVRLAHWRIYAILQIEFQQAIYLWLSMKSDLYCLPCQIVVDNFPSLFQTFFFSAGASYKLTK